MSIEGSELIEIVRECHSGSPERGNRECVMGRSHLDSAYTPNSCGRGHRVFIDLSRFKDYIFKKEFGMYTGEDVQCSVSKQLYSTTIDLEDVIPYSSSS